MSAPFEECLRSARKALLRSAFLQVCFLDDMLCVSCRPCEDDWSFYPGYVTHIYNFAGLAPPDHISFASTKAAVHEQHDRTRTAQQVLFFFIL